MTSLTGLFSRGSSYYLKVVLPADHPARPNYRNGRMVLTLGAINKRDAINKGTILRAEILRGGSPTGARVPARSPVQAAQVAVAVGAAGGRAAAPVYLSDVFDKWVDAKPRSDDTVAACKRALVLFEEQTGNPTLSGLARASGIAFRTWLQHPDRGTSSKTARDRLTWVKSLLKFAVVDLELIPRSPWERLDIDATTENRRRPWTDAELKFLFSQPLHAARDLPTEWNAGREAAYWIPLLGLFTGARIGELAQLRVADVSVGSDVPTLIITNEGEGQRVKTDAGVRSVPIHSELIRLGFLDYTDALRVLKVERLWPDLQLPKKKPGSYFSNWFGDYRRKLGMANGPDFHCFRHTVRSALACADVSEPMIDQLIGHEIKGSTGAKTYTHRTIAQMKSAIEQIKFAGLTLTRTFPMPAST